MVSGQCFLYTFWPSATFNRIFGVIVLFVEIFIPLIIMIFCYGRIIWTLTRRLDSDLDNKGTPTNDTFQIARSNMIKTFLLVAICFVICWSSNGVFYLMYNLGCDTDFNTTFYKVSVILAFCNCTVNPFIYLLKYRDYQIALKLCFGFWNREAQDMSDSKVSVSNVSESTFNQ